MPPQTQPFRTSSPHGQCAELRTLASLLVYEELNSQGQNFQGKAQGFETMFSEMGREAKSDPCVIRKVD